MNESRANSIQTWHSKHASVEAPLVESTASEYSEAGTKSTVVSRIVAWLPALYLPLIVVLCIAYTWRPLGGGDDIWAHAAVGRWICNNMEVPRHTLFCGARHPCRGSRNSGCLKSSSTSFAEWRACSGSAVHRSHGNAHFFVVVAFMGAPCADQHFYAAHVCDCHIRRIVALSTAPRIVHRVVSGDYYHLPGGLVAEAHRSEARCAALAAFFDGATFVLLFMFALWANLHGAVAMGILIVLLTAFCDAVQDRFDARSRSLLCIAVLCVLATFINPNGVGLWNEILRPIGSETFKNIDEWKPPLQTRALWSYAFCELVLVLAALAVWSLNPQRRWSHAAWLLVMSALFLQQRRHLWLFALVSLAVLAINARHLNAARMWAWWRKTTRQADIALPQPFRIIGRSSAVLCLGMWIAFATPYNFWPLRATKKDLPDGAARFVEANNLRGRLFNDYENSSYLQWRLNGPMPSGPNRGRVLARGRRPLYIDLLNAYPDTLLKDYLAIMDNHAAGRARFEQLDLGYVILGSEKRKNKLAKYLDRTSQWARVYDADNGVVWVRRAVNPSIR
jgi:hypothetical protein